MFKGILLSSLALCASLAFTMPAPEAETDTPPTQADQRFKAKYGMWPPHITHDKRSEQERERSTKQTKETKEKASKAQSERTRN